MGFLKEITGKSDGVQAGQGGQEGKWPKNIRKMGVGGPKGLPKAKPKKKGEKWCDEGASGSKMKVKCVFLMFSLCFPMVPYDYIGFP